ncbi:MAG: hypothetical protein ACHREM_14325 [Polyangiales bacterium]
MASTSIVVARWFGLRSLVVLAACVLPACGGTTDNAAPPASDDATTDTFGSEAAVDGTTTDTFGSEATVDSTTTDTFGSEATVDGTTTDTFGGDSAVDGTSSDGLTCTSGAACTGIDGFAGIYDASCTCTGCPSADATGDTACVGAYGSGYLCFVTSTASLECTPAECRSTASATPTCSSGQLCVAGACDACAATSDCTATTAYGAGFVCSAGACVKGNCVTSADCTGSTSGELCVANKCSKCASDSACEIDPTYAAAGKTICDVPSGKCSSALCGPTTTATACGPSSDHTCCATSCLDGTTFTASGANKSCCSNLDCATTSPNCLGNVCTSCPAVTGGTFYVDPIHGNDSGGTGATTTNCAFKTIGHALSVVGPIAFGSLSPIRVVVGGDVASASGESFPIVLPANVTVVGGDSSFAKTNRTVTVDAGKLGFLLAGKSASLSTLTITGSTTARFQTGVEMLDATGLLPASIDHVTVQHSASTGIVVGGILGGVVYGGVLSINSGVTVIDSGTADARANGLTVAGDAIVTITGGNTSADADHFDGNTWHGIVVDNVASLTIVGGTPVSPFDSASVTASNNYIAGLSIFTSVTTLAPLSTVTGLVVLGTTSGNGIRIEGGSHVKLRKSVALGSAGSGVIVVQSGQSGTALQINDIQGIDLGRPGDPGLNVVQVPEPAFGVTPSAGSAPNGGAGICLIIDGENDGGSGLAAEGNTLVTAANTSIDCSVSGSTGIAVTARTTCCASTRPTKKSAGLAVSLGAVTAAGATTPAAFDDAVCN